MFKKFIAALQIVKNRDKIKAVVNGTYSAIVKTLEALKFISEQTNDTKLGQLLQKHLPQTIAVLSKIKSVFEKFGPYVGLEVIEGQQLAEEASVVNSLNRAETVLDELLK